MKKAGITLAAIGGILFFLLKAAKLMYDYKEISKESDKIITVETIDYYPKTLNAAKGYFYNDSTKTWVINKNIIAPYTTTNPNLGLNFTSIQIAKVKADKHIYYVLIYFTKGLNTNREDIINEVPTYDDYTSNYILLKPSSFVNLTNYINSTEKETYSVKAYFRSLGDRKERPFSDGDIKQQIGNVLTDAVYLYGEVNRSNFLVKKDSTNNTLKFLLPDGYSYRLSINPDIIEEKYFECPLDSFKKLITPEL